MVFDHSPDAIFVEDRHGLILDANPAACKLHGLSRDEIIGKNVTDLVPEEHRERVAREFAMWFTGELDFYEGFSLNSQGEAVPVEIRAALARHNGDDAVILHVRDVSRRKQAELALRRSEEQLRQSQKMEALGRLAGGVAHDFNNLLTSILGFGNLVLEGLGPDSRSRSDVEEIIRAGERATHLTRRLLALGRKQMVDLRFVSLNASVIDIEKFLHRTLGEDIDLAMDLCGDQDTIMADPGQLEQIIVNLAINSRDAMPQGGTLEIRTRVVSSESIAVLRLLRQDAPAYVMLAVKDSGCGMSAEVREHVFAPFFTTKRVGEGTGLGLSTVYGLVRQFGGLIELDTEEGRGSEFRIYFPQVASAVVAARPAVPERSLPGGNETVLVVEDEETVRHLTVRLVRSLGYTVWSASNGGEALLLCENRPEPLHLILTDVIMPQMNGCDLVDRLRKIRTDFKVLYMTGFTQDVVLRHGLPDDQRAVISKPFSVQDLAFRIRAVLDPP